MLFSPCTRRFSVEMVNQNFGTINQLAVIVPCGDYEKEGQALRELERLPEVNSCMGLANIEAMEGYVLTEQLSPREFAELIDMDIEVADLLYSVICGGRQQLRGAAGRYQRVQGAADRYVPVHI